MTKKKIIKPVLDEEEPRDTIFSMIPAHKARSAWNLIRDTVECAEECLDCLIAWGIPENKAKTALLFKLFLALECPEFLELPPHG